MAAPTTEPQPEAANASKAQHVIADTDARSAANVQQGTPAANERAPEEADTVHHPGDDMQLDSERQAGEKPDFEK